MDKLPMHMRQQRAAQRQCWTDKTHDFRNQSPRHLDAACSDGNRHSH
jgi:hypothetical protein